MNRYRKHILILTLIAAGSLLLMALYFLIAYTELGIWLRNLVTEMDDIRGDGGVDDVEGYGLIFMGLGAFLGAIGALFAYFIAGAHLLLGGFSVLFAVLSGCFAEKQKRIHRIITAVLSFLPLLLAGVVYALYLLDGAFSVGALLIMLLLFDNSIAVITLLIKERKTV